MLSNAPRRKATTRSCPLGTLDLGVDGGKSAVDIPVVGPTEACLHVASLIGDRFGVMVYHPSLVAFSRAIIRRYGMEDRVVDFGVSGFDLPDLAAHHDEVVENFVKEAKRLVEQGAEVIYPMGISQCPVHIKPDWLQEQLGVPVVEGFGTPIRMAALLAGLGLKQSRAALGEIAKFMNMSAILLPKRLHAMQKSHECHSEPGEAKNFDHPHPSLSHRNGRG